MLKFVTCVSYHVMMLYQNGIDMIILLIIENLIYFEMQFIG